MRRHVRRHSRLLTRSDEAGSGLVATTVGVLIFLSFVLLATQVLLGLYTTSLVTSAAVDAATEVAHSANPTSAAVQEDATGRARRRLGAFAQQSGHLELDWTQTSGDDVVLTVHARAMTFVPQRFGAALGGRIDRTVRVRTERMR